MTINEKSIQLKHDIITLRQENPVMTLQQIAMTVNRTKERVRQILVSAGIETRSAKRIESASRPTPICRTCNKEVRMNEKRYKRTYCDECISTKIWHIDMGLRRRRIPRIDIPCAYCNKTITMRETLYKRQQIRHKNLYCSKSCRSKGLWANQIIINVGGKIRSVRLGEVVFIEEDRDD